MASFTILFYDYLLTLEDEVCQGCPPCSFEFLLTPRIAEGQICMVWRKIVECARHRKCNLASADLWSAFWLFIIVRLIRPFQDHYIS